MIKFEAPAPQIPEILSLHGKWLAKKEAVIFEDTRLNWGQFSKRINTIANGLIALGLKRGDHVVVLMSNGIEMVETLFGIMTAGCTSVPLNVSIADDSIKAMTLDSDSIMVICTEDHAQRLIGKEVPGVSYITTGHASEGWSSYQTVFENKSDNYPNVAIEPDDLLNIIYSSGTTGLPKGIAHSFSGRRDWAYDLAIALRYHTGARTLLTIGLYSNISWVAMLTTLMAGGTIIIHKHFNAEGFWKTSSQEKVTHTAMVPIQFQRLTEVDTINAQAAQHFMGLMSCGSPLNEGLKRKLFDIFDCGVIELYGLTEGIITTLDPEDVEGRWGSVGKPLIGTDIAIIDDDDQLLGHGASGEIVSRGRITMPFYYNRPDATQATMYTDPQGQVWIRSGDIGYTNDEGFLYIVDRKKDMILSGGQNIYPQDIEAILIQHEEINDVAVIAAPSERWGETPIALVVAHTGTTPDPTEIISWCNSRVGKQQRIADVILLTDLPRNPNGKILKRELRKTYVNKQYA